MTARRSHDGRQVGPDGSHGGHGGHADHDPAARTDEKSLKTAFAPDLAFLRACRKLSGREPLEGRGSAKGAGLLPPLNGNAARDPTWLLGVGNPKRLVQIRDESVKRPLDGGHPGLDRPSMRAGRVVRVRVQCIGDEIQGYNEFGSGGLNRSTFR